MSLASHGEEQTRRKNNLHATRCRCSRAQKSDAKWPWNRGKSGSSRAFHVSFVAVELTNPTELVPLLLLLLLFSGVKNEEAFFGSAISTVRRRRDTTRRRPLACVVGEWELAGEVNGSREAGASLIISLGCGG